MSIFDIKCDIERAETLSSKFYTDEEYFHQAKEKIFARSWQLIGTTNEINNLKPFTILENYLNEPVLITKSNGKLNCLSNVCTHRGKILIENECQANGIRCNYHGRRFDLKGKFLSMPEFERAENFPSEKDDLPEVPLAVWEKFLFASLNPFAPFEDFTAEIKARLKNINLEDLRFHSAKDYEIKAHWALYCENYLEGFHIPFVHSGLNEAIDYGAYTTETFRFSNLQTAYAKSGEVAFDFDDKLAALYFFVFPNLMLNFYPWGLSINVVKPVEKDLTKISYLTYVSDETKLTQVASYKI